MTVRSVTAHHLFDKIAGFCKQSDPDCDVAQLSSPDEGVLKFIAKSGRTVVYESHDLSVAELTTMSDNELWELLEHLSSHRIKRPVHS